MKVRTAENEETPARVRVRSRALDLYFLKLRGVVFSRLWMHNVWVDTWYVVP